VAVSPASHTSAGIFGLADDTLEIVLDANGASICSAPHGQQRNT
jgi:hypothetical protein